MKYILYARKSTDEDDRQILSIEAQLAELKEFAAKEKLEIAASLCEAKTAKEPGRMKFGEMLALIEQGKADGIISWHPDRLARNSIDGGRIIYMVDTGKIKSLKFPTFWFEGTPQGKFMLNIAFGQSKYFIDNLSENVKRGLRQKLRNGVYPGWAPLGYLNEPKHHDIVIDPVKHKLIRKLFEIYSTGEYTVEVLTSRFNELGLTSVRNSSLHLSVIHRMLRSPFYYGVFRYKGELHEGKHEPIITKKLFDKVQEVMNYRGKKKKIIKHGFVFTGLLKCPCGCSITAETRKGHIYYRCTKKKGPCDEKYIREEKLTEQFKNIIQKVSLPDDWADNILNELDKEKINAAQSSVALVEKTRAEIRKTEIRLDNLLNDRIDGIIEKADYLNKKDSLIKEKLDIEDKIREIKDKGNNWLEPMRDFILRSKLAKKTAAEGDLSQIKAFLKNIGSDFILQGKKFEFLAKLEWELASRSDAFPN